MMPGQNNNGPNQQPAPPTELIPNAAFDSDRLTVEFDQETHNEFVERALEGAKNIFKTFADAERVSEDDLFNYLASKDQGALSPYESELKKHLDVVLMPDASADPKVIAVSERHVANLVEYINKRNAILKQNRRSLQTFQPNSREIPKPINTAYGYTKDILGATTKGFLNSTPTEMAMMAGGMVASFFLLRSMYNRAPGGPVGRLIKSTFKWAVGGFLIVGGIAMANKAVERTSGRPLLDWNDGEWLPRSPLIGQSQEGWNAMKEQQRIQEVRTLIRDLNIPDDFIESLDENERKVVPPVANISALDIEEFIDLYEATKDAKAIMDNDPLYPRRPVKKDMLLPSERFSIVRGIARALDIIDDAGNVLPVPQERAGIPMMTLMLDFKKVEKK